jgi:uncharacterized SAM-dependent methyltransferase
MYLHCQKSHWVSLDVLGLKVNFEAGESILTEISRKFNLATMEKNLSDKGLKTVKTWTDEKGWFGLILCKLK